MKKFVHKYSSDIEHILETPYFTKENFIYEQKAVLVDITQLIEHESVDLSYLGKLKEEITKDGFLRKAISVDINSMVVLDGHHRLNALIEIGCKKIPVIFVDYRSPDIVVKKWTGEDNITLDDVIVTKEYIVSTALSGKRLPVKTSKHLIMLDGEFQHISVIEIDVDEPLKNLKSGR